MLKELEIDLKDYILGGTVFKRTAARGIIRRDNKYLIIYSKYGDYKFPGGGMEQGESIIETLLREVKEETGYTVITDSIKEFMLVHEKRKGETDDLIIMDSHYYLCNVEEHAGESNLVDYEVEYEYKKEWLELDEIIRRNEAVADKENIPWLDRELMVLKELQKLKM